jgi:type II secretory pathway pseudopilin PulG
MRKQSLAFTLIEMLVVITIMMLMLGGGIAAYINFNENQQLLSAAKQMQTYLRGLQKKSRVGDRPDGCTRLYSYTLTVAANSNLVFMQANCENGDFDTDNYTLGGGVTALNEIEVSFKVLQGGATSQGNIILVKNTDRYQFQVTPGGEITEGAKVE